MLLILLWSCAAYAAIIHTSRATGSPRSVLLTTSDLHSHSRSLQALEEHTTLESFIKSHPSYGIQDPASELKLTGTIKVPHAEERSVQTYQQVFESVPVLGATLKVVTDQGKIDMVNGVTVPNLQIDTSPRIDSLIARGLAVEYLATKLALPQGTLSVDSASSPTLSIYKPDLANDLPGPNYLAYRIAFDSLGSNHLVFVDAHNGDVVGAHLFLHSFLEREVYNGTDTDVIWTEDDNYPSNFKDWDRNAMDAAKDTYDLFKILTGYDSYDNGGSPLVARFSDSADCTVNWHSEGNYFQYCTSNLSYDTAVHEWAHAYTERLDQLQYFSQAGALHESFSDIVAASIEILTHQTIDRTEDCTSDQQGMADTNQKLRWRVGDDYAYDENSNLVANAIFHDLWRPSCFPFDNHPDKTANIRCAAKDNGETHINSLIPSTVFAHATEAIQKLTGNGLSKMLYIYMRAKLECQYATTTLAHHAFCVQLACDNLAEVGTQLPMFDENGNGISLSITQSISHGDCEELKTAIKNAGLENTHLCANKGLTIGFMYPSVLPLTGGLVTVHIGGPAITKLYMRIGDSEDYFEDSIVSNQDAPGYIVHYPFPPLSRIGSRIEPHVFIPEFSTDGTNWVQAGHNISYLSTPMFLRIEPREETVLGGNIITVTGKGFIQAQGCTRNSLMAFDRGNDILDDCFVVMLNNMRVDPLVESEYISNSSTLYLRMPPADELGLVANDTVNVSISVNGGATFFHSMHFYRYVHMARIKDLKIEECTNGNDDTFLPTFHPNNFAYDCEVYNDQANRRDVTEVTANFNYTEEGQTHTSRLIHAFGDVSHVGMVTGVNLLEIVVWSKDKARHQTYQVKLNRTNSVDARIAELIWVDNTSATCNIAWDPDVFEYNCTVEYFVDALHFETKPVYFQTTVVEENTQLFPVDNLQPVTTNIKIVAEAEAHTDELHINQLYRINVKKLPNRDARLGSLSVTYCDFGKFHPDVFDYSCTVGPDMCDQQLVVDKIELVRSPNGNSKIYDFGGTLDNIDPWKYTLTSSNPNDNCTDGFSGTISITSTIPFCPATDEDLQDRKSECVNQTIAQNEACVYDWTCEPVTYTINVTVAPYHDADVLHVVYAAVKVRRLEYDHHQGFFTAQAHDDLATAIQDQLDFKINVDPPLQNVSRNITQLFNVEVDWDVSSIKIDIKIATVSDNNPYNRIFECNRNLNYAEYNFSDLGQTFDPAEEAFSSCQKSPLGTELQDISIGDGMSQGFWLLQTPSLFGPPTRWFWWFFNVTRKNTNTDLSISLLEPIPQEKEYCPDFVFDPSKKIYECAVSHEVTRLNFNAMPASILSVLYVNGEMYMRPFISTEPNVLEFADFPIGQNKSFQIASRINCSYLEDVDNCSYLEDVYTVVITRDYSDAATLKMLSHSDCVTFLPEFTPTLVSGYRCEVPFETTEFNSSGLSYERTHHRGADNHEGVSLFTSMALEVGIPAVAWVFVTAPNQKDSLNYSMTVVRLEQDETRLESIQVKMTAKFFESDVQLDLIPAFDRSNTLYKVLLPQNVDEVEMTAIAVDPLSTIRIGPTTNLRIGPNEGEIVVTAQNHHDVLHYFVTLLRGNDEAHLHKLTVGCNAFVFEPEKFYYDLKESGCDIVQDQIIPETKDQDALWVVQNMTFGTVVVHTVVVTSSSGRRQLRYDIDSSTASGRRLQGGSRPESVQVKDCKILGREYNKDIGVFSCILDYTVENVTFNVSDFNVSDVKIKSITWTRPGHDSIDYAYNDYLSNPPRLNRSETNEFKICFMEYDGCVTVYVTRPKNGDSYLSNLEVEGCVLDPAFSKDIEDYVCNISHPLINKTSVTFTLNSKHSYSDCCDWPSFIEPGSTKYAEVRVIAEDDTVRAYKINITRPLDDDASLKFMNFDDVCLSADKHHFHRDLDGIHPQFDKSNTTQLYTCVISAESEAMGPTFETNSSFAYVTTKNTRQVPPGTTDASISITAYGNKDSKQTFKFLIIKPSGQKNPTSSIVYLDIQGCNAYDPEVRSNVTNYKCRVANENRIVNLNATTTEKEAHLDWNGTNPRMLSVNTNQLTLKVTSSFNESISTKYTIEIEREPSDDAGLADFGVHSCDVSAPIINNTPYNCTVLYQVKEIHFFPRPTDQDATVVSKSIDDIDSETMLKVGQNRITVTVQSSSKQVNSEYILMVTRAPANADASLMSLSVPGCELSPPFQPSIYFYTCVVSANVTDVAPDYQANSTKKQSVVLNKPALLDFGYNVMTINVTAEAFSNSSLYEIVVTRTFTEETAPSKLTNQTVIIKDLHFNNTALEYDILNGEDMNTFTAKLMSDLYFHLELKSQFTVVGVSEASKTGDLVVDVGVFLTNGNIEDSRILAFISALDLYLKALDENSEVSDKESSTIYSRSPANTVIRTFIGPVPTEFDVQDIRFLDKENAVEYLGTNDGIREYWIDDKIEKTEPTNTLAPEVIGGIVAGSVCFVVIVVVIVWALLRRRKNSDRTEKQGAVQMI